MHSTKPTRTLPQLSYGALDIYYKRQNHDKHVICLL